MKKVIEAVRSRIHRNPRRKQKLLVSDMEISMKTVLRILTDDLHLKAYKQYTGHLLDVCLKRIWLERSKKLLRLYGILWRGKKPESFEETARKHRNNSSGITKKIIEKL